MVPDDDERSQTGDVPDSDQPWLHYHTHRRVLNPQEHRSQRSGRGSSHVGGESVLPGGFLCSSLFLTFALSDQCSCISLGGFVGF